MRSILWVILLLFCGTAFGQVASPCAFSPAGGSYATPQSVTMTSNPGTIIFYTTDGSTPTHTSKQYTGPVSVTTSQTIKCIAAVVGVKQDNIQNNNPSLPGTYWKIAQCASFTAWSTTTAYATGAKVSQGGFNWVATAASTGKTPSSNPSFWSMYSNCAADNPGGSGVANPVSQVSGISVPSLSGASMLFSSTSQPGAQTNVLWPVKSPFGSCNLCTYFLEIHDYFWPSTSTASSKEDDSFSFDPSRGIRLMAGGQYCRQASGCPGGVQGWDYGGNSNVPWTFSGVTAGGTLNVWHNYKKLFHAVTAEYTTKPCSASGSWPYIYLDQLVIDNTIFDNGGTGWKFCANALPAGWSSLTGPQAQNDIASHTTATADTTYWDNIQFIATYDPSAPVSSSYAISASGVPPLIFRGKITFKGTILTQ